MSYHHHYGHHGGHYHYEHCEPRIHCEPEPHHVVVHEPHYVSYPPHHHHYEHGHVEYHHPHHHYEHYVGLAVFFSVLLLLSTMGCSLSRLQDGSFLYYLKKRENGIEDDQHEDKNPNERRHYSSISQSEDRLPIPFQDPLGVVFCMEGLDYVENFESTY
ncbi:hypothetical protein QR680_013772 [Steinernema hermaphroditum]|uniref:Uncharacterized protein n=1 Tax=Steinernema hermaphroditum TaxID=289476 RepID=A0AA39M233_9BILA|nr:hypothetical protein QR680_013772 [Steinernema hermaphroditum]